MLEKRIISIAVGRTLMKKSRSPYALTTATCSRAPLRKNLSDGVARAAQISDQSRPSLVALKEFVFHSSTADLHPYPWTAKINSIHQSP
jgi:predicted ATPase